MLIKIKDKEYNEDELAVLSKAGVLEIAQKNDPASTSLTATPALHGPLQGNDAQFGIFTDEGVRPQRFSAFTRPLSWLDIVNVNRSDYTNEILEIVTGQLSAGSVTNATGFCGNPPVAKGLKVCQQTYTFGDLYVKTNLNAVPLVGQRKNRADIPANILNNVGPNNPFIPDILTRMTDTRSQLGYELYILGNEVERSTETVSIQGTAGSDNSRFGWFNEYAGLSGLIKDGYTDAKSGVTCPAADSLIESFNALITGTHSDGSSRTFLDTFMETTFALKDIAQGVGMETTQWAIVMRKELFRNVVFQLADNYNFYQVTGGQYEERNLDAREVQALRREMMTRQYLLDSYGMPWPVVFSEGLTNPPVANNTYVSDMLFVPVSWNGTPLLRLEYFPMDNDYAQEFATFVGTNEVQTMNNGMYIVGKRSTGLCMEYHMAARMRLILETPFLAGRIDDIRYTYYAKTRQAIPGSSLYVDGGVSAR